MNGTTKNESYGAKIIAERFLLTDSLSRYPNRVILVAVPSTIAGATAEVSLSIAVPGGSDAPDLRQRLLIWMQQALPAIHPDWVVEVEMTGHFSTGEPLIQAVINIPGLLGGMSDSRVLEAARLFLEPYAASTYRRVVTLAANQRLVPLDFETDEIYPRDLRVQLPKELTFARPRLVTCEWRGDSADHAASFLEAALKMALDQYELIEDVFVRATPAGLVISLPFSGRVIDRPAYLLNQIEETICGVVSRHASLLNAFYTELVFVPAHPHRALTDDGGDDGDRYEEY